MRHKQNELFGHDLKHFADRRSRLPLRRRLLRRLAAGLALASGVAIGVMFWLADRALVEPHPDPVAASRPGEPVSVHARIATDAGIDGAADAREPELVSVAAGVATDAGIAGVAEAREPEPLDEARASPTLPSRGSDSGLDRGDSATDRRPRPSVAALRFRPGEPPPREEELDGEVLAEFAPGADWVAVEVRRGDNLGLIFRRNGLPVAEAMSVAELDAETALHRLRVGDTIRLLRSPDQQLLALEYDLGPEQTLRIERADEGFQSTRLDRDLEERHRYLQGTVRTSLSQAAADAGLPHQHLMQLVEVFGWDVDFALDLQPGDRFTAIISERFWEGEKVADGDLLAAEFVNNGRSLRAIRFHDADETVEYFTPEGYGLRRAFLRTPVKYARISSGFSERRYHPVLGRWRAHRGVDYAAPTGTPVMVTADGRISRATRERGYGNFIVVDHGGTYSTLYAHLSRFRDGLRTGDRVRQGQVIGYVGLTGLATGPHLHYEFRVNGTHKDPLTVELPKSQPIRDELREAFLTHAEKWNKRLDSLARDQRVADTGRQGPRDTL